MAIKPSFADIVYKGQKLYEYRRVEAKINSGDRVVIYESFPVSQLTGEFSVGRVIVGKPQDLFQLEPSKKIKSLINRYLTGAKVASAIEIVNVRRWGIPQPFLKLFPDLRPPQSYIFVKE